MKQSGTLLSQVTPSRASTARDLPALETVMQGLALPQTVVALEIAAAARQRSFLLRAEQPAALLHLERQMQARYPQAVIRRVEQDQDPWQLADDEEASMFELRPGAARDLPLRSWRTRELLEEGTDPILGILAACDGVPTYGRLVAQLALTPLAPAWSTPFRRRAVEHPLEPERQRQRLHNGTQPPGLRQVALLFVVVVIFLLVSHFQKQLRAALPPWVSTAGQSLIHGQTPHLSSPQMVQLVGMAFILLCGVLIVGFGVLVVAGRFGQTSMYDQRLIEEKTKRSAYRARLRLLVVGPGEKWPMIRSPRQQQGRRRVVARWQHWKRKGWRQGFHLALHREKARWRGGQRRLLGQWKRRQEREQALHMLIGAYAQYHLAAGGFFRPVRLWSKHAQRLLHPHVGLLRSRAGWAEDVTRSVHVLSVADVAALWHLPEAQDLAEIAYLEQEVMRTLPVPTVLSSQQNGSYLLGESTHAGHCDPVYFPLSCLQQNMLAVASTGKGKSTLFAHLIQALALARLAGQPEAQGGAFLIDPHGDLAATVAGSLPAALIDDIVLLNLADQSSPIGFNVLDMASGQDVDKSVDNLIQIIEALWPTSYGPRTENFLEYGCKTLASANQTFLALDPEHGPTQQFTLLDLVPLFRQESFRHAVFEYVADQRILDWWNNYYEQLDGKQQADFTSSLITKISKFASSRMSRRILGQAHSSLDFGELIRQRKIILLSCASGEIGADLAALFGSLLVGFFHITLAEQARLRLQERNRFLVLIDEFQTLKVDYQTMLAELRKYGGSFALATQSLAYLDRFERTLRATVLANVEHLFAFAMADEDARLLRFPGIEPEDVLHLPNYTCYARLSLAGQRLPVFSMRLASPLPEHDQQRQDLLHRAQTRYGRPLGQVERGLQENEARQKAMRPARRKGAKGYEVLWSGSGEDRVIDVLARAREHERGGKGKKGEATTAPEETIPEHTMYGPEQGVDDPVLKSEELGGGTDEEPATEAI